MTLAERLCSPVVEERRAAIAELSARAAAGAGELEALGVCLGDGQKAVQRPAAEAFATLGARGVAVEGVLLIALQDRDPRRRWGAAFALSLLGEPPVRTLPVVLETLGSDDGDLRWAAVKILLRIRERDAVLAALHPLVGAPSPVARKMALYALRDLGARSPAGERAALAGLDDADAGVRLAAMSALAHLAGDRAAAATRLVETLERDAPPLRRAAAASLGILGERSATVQEALRRAATDPDAALRRAAARALERLGR